ncbi:PAS domain S-box protein [Leptolyngbya sp. FACHB-671]|uniref:PAS domain S-box protein n=1 Tax=Leptolyngbya sp. FACHB-671 TaxID=2692812 RepID=UPI00168A2AE6|nr:PAS domain S-box protein [Leptolyngbya sp. FACHB-671]MBD2071180.1 PAS domain S-box protein [Leptolyngbya sp. FACHB-671]
MKLTPITYRVPFAVLANQNVIITTDVQQPSEQNSVIQGQDVQGCVGLNMQTHFSRQRDVGSLSTRQWGAMFLAIPVICLTVPLIWSLWIRQQSVSDRPTDQTTAETDTPQLLDEQNQQLEQQRSLILVLAIAASIGILSSAAAWYFLNRLSQELQERTKQLQESESLTQAIAANVVDGIITLNQQGQIETFNQAAMQMFGYEPAEVKGKEISVLLPLSDENGEAIAQDDQNQIVPKTITGKLFQPVRQQKGMGKHKAGTPFPIEVSVSDIPVNDRHIVVIHDITAKEQAEAELQRQSNELNRLDTALTKTKAELQSVYVACYDLKSPLQAISHLSKWIESDLSNWVVEETQPQMNLLRERVDRMEGLIHGILQQSPGKDEE